MTPGAAMLIGTTNVLMRHRLIPIAYSVITSVSQVARATVTRGKFLWKIWVSPSVSAQMEL
jgi:hypothetical protein